MNDTGIRQVILDEICALAKNRVQKVILFGSRARNNFKRTIDINLAVSGE